MGNGLTCLRFGCIATGLDWQWFELSGFLVVIVALCFFWQDRIDRDEEFIQKMIDYENECKETLQPITPKTEFSKVELVAYYNVDEDNAKAHIVN